MTKTGLIRLVVKLYFVGALTGSFIHLVHAGFKGGLGSESYAIPFMIDGLAVSGMVLRSGDFAKHTNKFGFRTQMIMGALSLAGNVYAAGNIAGAVFGIALVGLYVFAESMLGHIETRESEQAREAAIAAEAAKVARRDTERKRRQAKARKSRQETRALESLLAG